MVLSHCVGTKSNPGPLQEPVLLTSEPSLQPWICCLLLLDDSNNFNTVTKIHLYDKIFKIKAQYFNYSIIDLET
jgi:hypothetical protein